MCCLLIMSVACVSNNKGDEQVIQDMQEDLDQMKEDLSGQYEETIDTLSKELDVMKERYDKLVESSDEWKVEGAQGKVDQYEFDGRDYIIYTRGANVLEDGVVIILESHDVDGELRWMHAFNGIPVAELSTYSSLAMDGDHLIVRVGDALYGFDKNSGNEAFSTSGVGKTDDAPLISKDGTIYVRGQYAPYVSAVGSSGELLWTLDDEAYLDVESIELSDDGVVLIGLDEEVYINKDGVVTTNN